MRLWDRESGRSCGWLGRPMEFWTLAAVKGSDGGRGVLEDVDGEMIVTTLRASKQIKESEIKYTLLLQT